MENRANAAHAELRRRARRLGLGFAAFGALMTWVLGSGYGVLAGACVVASGLYLAFAYVPLAAWIRRLEQRRRT